MSEIYLAVGGRKQFNAMLGAALLTGMAWHLGATFESYALWLSVVLLGNAAANVSQKKILK